MEIRVKLTLPPCYADEQMDILEECVKRIREIEKKSAVVCTLLEMEVKDFLSKNSDSIFDNLDWLVVETDEEATKPIVKITSDPAASDPVQTNGDYRVRFKYLPVLRARRKTKGGGVVTVETKEKS